MATSRHISPVQTFLPNVGTGFFSALYPDSGLGLAGVWFFNERFKVMGLVSDANTDRFNFGDITAGGFYKAIEISYKIAPKAKKAGFSKFAVCTTTEPKTGKPATPAPALRFGG